MALKKHFRDSCNTAEIAVNLEWRMNIKKIVCRAFFKQIFKVFVCIFTVFKSGIETNCPCS